VDKVKTLRITPCTLITANFFTRCAAHGIPSQAFATTTLSKVTAPKVESGGSDPTFLRTVRPKVSWGRSRARRHFASTFCAVTPSALDSVRQAV